MTTPSVIPESVSGRGEALLRHGRDRLSGTQHKTRRSHKIHYELRARFAGSRLSFDRARSHSAGMTDRCERVEA